VLGQFGAPPTIAGQPPVGVVNQPPGTFAPEVIPPGDNVIYPSDGVGFLTPDVPRPIDITALVEETQTGRFMFGVGVNSDAGVVGNIVINELNFDLFRWPTSWTDFRDGTAFRGAGQQLRIEAVPGTQLNRYIINFREPYLFDSLISLGVSGFFFDRRFQDWDEERLGGRVTLGYQFPYAPDLSVSASLRAEKVNINNPRLPTPPELAPVLGDNGIYSGRVALAHDTRDSTFLPTEGHLIELGYEQVFGDFDYPRGTLEASKYFLIRQRPDTSGRHVLSVTGQVGISGNQTPVFENFFAGGFSTLRGFDFRGASPQSLGVFVGGQFQFLGSVEYMLPLTADDMLRGVVFVDFGTVEESVKLEEDDFRVAPGFGLRITVPALGPAPIALDFAFPVAHEDGDDLRVFSFFVGFGR